MELQVTLRHVLLGPLSGCRGDQGELHAGRDAPSPRGADNQKASCPMRAAKVPPRRPIPRQRVALALPALGTAPADQVEEELLAGAPPPMTLVELAVDLYVLSVHLPPRTTLLTM